MQTAAGHRRLRVYTLLWAALFVVATILVLTNLGELRRIGGAFRSADWRYAAGAAALELLFVVNLALFYTTTFRASRVRAQPGRFVLLTSASHFVNLVSKTGGLGGVALYLREAQRTGDSATRVTAAYMTAFALGYLAYVVTLLAALALLYARGTLTSAEVIAAGVIISIVAATAAVMAAGLRSQRSLERLYLLAARPLNGAARLLRQGPVIDPETAQETTAEMYDAVAHIKANPGHYAVPFGHALGVEVISAGMLYFVALALYGNIGFDVALAGYAISLLFSMVAITPAGLGFVEASLSVLLVSFGVQRHDAIAIALGYRLFEFWMPVLLGAVSLHFLRAPSRPKTSP